MWAALRLSLLVALFASTASVLNAQSKPDRVLHGTVVDSTRAPISGAQVTAVSDTESVPASARTDQDGVFTLPVHPGEYRVQVHSDGFRDAEQRVVAGPASAAPTEFILQLAGLNEAVTVAAPSGYQVPTITTATKTPHAAA